LPSRHERDKRMIHTPSFLLPTMDQAISGSARFQKLASHAKEALVDDGRPAVSLAIAN